MEGEARGSPQGAAKWMAGVSAAPTGPGQTWSLPLLPSTQLDGPSRNAHQRVFMGFICPQGNTKSVAKSHK